MILDIASHLFIFAPVVTVLVYNLFDHGFARRHFYRFAGAGALIELMSALAAGAALIVSNASCYEFGIFSAMSAPAAAYFELTPLNLFFMAVIGLVSFISVLIAKQTVDFNRSSYTNLLMILMLGMNGMLLVSDLFSLYVFMEVTGICCFVMIAMFRSKADLEGSFKYLVMSELASIFILSGIAFLLMKTGSVRYEDLAALTPGGQDVRDRLVEIGIVLLLAGFSVKTGVVPFHSWLPDAHQSADTSVSVLLSGIVIKIAGVYGLLCVSRLFSAFNSIGPVLAATGTLSIIAGALLALRQSHFKRVVAYSSVSQMGYILLGLSTGTTLGLVGALAHVFSHAVFKSTLFANAAALHERAGTLELDELGGLEERMPKTAFSSVVAFLSTAGVPPTAGFWSKLLILLALWSSGSRALAGVALIAGILTSVYMLRIQKKVFFGHIKDTLKDVREIGGTVLASELVLSAITILTGFAYPFILMFLSARGLI